MSWEVFRNDWGLMPGARITCSLVISFGFFCTLQDQYVSTTLLWALKVCSPRIISYILFESLFSVEGNSFIVQFSVTILTVLCATVRVWVIRLMQYIGLQLGPFMVFLINSGGYKISQDGQAGVRLRVIIEIESNTHTDFDSRCEREVELKVTDGILLSSGTRVL